MDFISQLPLKRDEFFTFLGGFYSAIVWSIHKSMSLGSWSQIDILLIMKFIVMWLTFTVGIYLVAAALTLIVFTGVRIVINIKDPIKSACDILGLSEYYENIYVKRIKEEKEVTKQFYHHSELSNIQIHLHLLMVIFINILICFKPFISSYYLCFETKILIIFIAISIIFYVYVKYTKRYLALYCLQNNKILFFTDSKKTYELNSEEFASQLFARDTKK